MKIWELEGERYPIYDERRGRGSYGGGSYNQHDTEYSEGYERGYRDAMKHVYGERSIHRSGTGLGREMYLRDDEMWGDEDMYDMRRRRDSRGRYM